MRSTTWMAVLPASPGTFNTFSDLILVMLVIVAIFNEIAQYEIKILQKGGLLERIYLRKAAAHSAMSLGPL